MKKQRFYLIAMYAILLVMGGVEFLFGYSENSTQQQLLLSVLFATISYLTAFMVPKWYGKILIIFHLIFTSLLPTILGAIASQLISKKRNHYPQSFCAVIAIVIYSFPILSYYQGGISNNWEPSIGYVAFMILRSISWYLICGYVLTVAEADLTIKNKSKRAA